MGKRRSIATITAIAVTGIGLAAAVTGSASAVPNRPASAGCQLANGVKHVIEIQFDNVHLTRDNPNVASDLEQMPQLLNFLKSNGTVMADTHDVLVHTATNFISNQTGLYPDRTAVTQSNSGSYYGPDGKTHTDVSFAYWNAPLFDPAGNSTNTGYNMRYTANRANVPNNSNVNVPAPWVPYTRAGCDVGEVGMSNTVLENINIDIPTVFGPGSPQQQEVTQNPAKATADFVGFAVHCGQSSGLCANGQTDSLPDEPGGYTGYKALFGNSSVQPATSPSGPINDLNGAPITDPIGNPGFPGFDSMTPNVSLGYAANLLEHGVQVANVYVSDAHTDHHNGTGDFGPGEQGYEQQLHEYDTAFGQFLTRLAHDGITPANTLFALADDEGDHFSGSDPSPAGCTGQVGNYCTYTTKSEVNVNLPGLLATAKGNTTPFAIHSDPAPALWLTGNPSRTDPSARQIARDMASTSFTNPLTGATDKLAYQLADPVEEKILHFVSSDATRTPTLTAFAGEDEYVTSGAANCSKPCVFTSSRFAWNHGGIWPDHQNIWSGYVGPGISARGVDHSTWTDQVDTRPTLLALAGLHDDYAGDGRVLVEITSSSALPPALRAHRDAVLKLGRVYKQLLGASGQFAQDTLAASTRALASGSASDDRTYTSTTAALAALGTARDRVADQIGAALLGAAFHGQPVDQRRATALTIEAQLLLAGARALAH
ncbi:MAG TPA: hypothetical protein VGL39_08860 [Jatrophihabitantaceae bacterium]|jgi:hypothetical protein